MSARPQRRWAPTACVLVWAPATAAAPGARTRTENVLLVTLDGVRCQELLEGLAADVADTPAGGVAHPEMLARRFKRSTPNDFRAAIPAAAPPLAGVIRDRAGRP